ncbi:MAG: DUF362 domain-containing protein [Deltaproteobacteria bacterium]|nr:DUF362 domain-containing protein [Deltaproteobacteria bacterium]
MSSIRRTISRRDFVQGAAAFALLGLSSTCRSRDQVPTPPEKKTRELPARSRVVLIRDENVVNSGRKVDPPIVSEMLDRGVCALTGRPDQAAAWGSLISPADIVGIKSNAWRFLPTPAEIEQILLKRVRSAGVPAGRANVDDRGILGNPVFERATCLVNVRPLRTHHWAGIGGCIKNYIMFSDNPPAWHDDSCANLAGVWDLPVCRDKTRLNILVMLTPLFHGKGPHHFNASYVWDYRGLILSADPVAADATGLRILLAKRKAHFGKEEPLYVPPKHVEVAETRYHLGLADPARIDVVKIGWAQDRFI